MSDNPVTPTTENPYPAEPVGSTAAHKRGAELDAPLVSDDPVNDPETNT